MKHIELLEVLQQN